jgi:2-(1,2-epoxy-1,2-dihydrophenyl)acetyl-CoA isomerase
MDPVLVERDGGIVTAVLNRPHKKNAVDAAMTRRLRAVIEEVQANPADRVLVLTGAGGDFSSGADLTTGGDEGPRRAAEGGSADAANDPANHPAARAAARDATGDATGDANGEVAGEATGEETEQSGESTQSGAPRRAAFASVRVGSGLRLVRSTLGDLALALHRLPKPTIAKVRGVAAGMGASLAFGCDLILAADDARFGQVFIRRGLALDTGASWLLPRLIGLHKAKELAFFGDMISAEEAAEIGIVNRVVAAADLDDLTDRWARRLAAQAPIALSLTKMALNTSSSRSMAEALEHEALAQNVCFQSRDLQESMQAFVERRDPVYRGE